MPRLITRSILLTALLAVFCLMAAPPLSAQDRSLRLLPFSLSNVQDVDTTLLDAGQRHPLLQDELARRLMDTETVWHQVDVPQLAPNRPVAIRLPKTMRGKMLSVSGPFTYSLLWERNGRYQASWIKSHGQPLAVPRSATGRILLIAENGGEDTATLRITLAPLPFSATQLRSFTVSPLGPFSASVSWQADESNDMMAWILQKRKHNGAWQPVLAAPIPTSPQESASYAFVDINRPQAGGAYRLVAIDAAGFAIPFRQILLTE